MLADLNLLRVFDVLLEERNVTQAGARLGLTQSAVSHALKRLRQTMGDELFVRSSSGMQPTPRAIEMGPQVRAALTQLQTALFPSAFDPSSSERRFVLMTGSYACTVLLPDMVAALASTAPRAELAVEDMAGDILERLDAHRVDFMVSSVLAAPERFARDSLVQEALVWVVRAGHPLTRRPVDLEALASIPHVVISRNHIADEVAGRRGLITRHSWEDAGALHIALAARGLSRRIGVSVPDTTAAMAVAAQTDMAALVPQRLARLAARGSRVEIIEPPYESPRAHLDLLFLKDRLAEPAVAWMRDLILASAASV